MPAPARSFQHLALAVLRQQRRGPTAENIESLPEWVKPHLAKPTVARLIEEHDLPPRLHDTVHELRELLALGLAGKHKQLSAELQTWAGDLRELNRSLGLLRRLPAASQLVLERELREHQWGMQSSKWLPPLLAPLFTLRDNLERVSQQMNAHLATLPRVGSPKRLTTVIVDMLLDDVAVHYPQLEKGALSKLAQDVVMPVFNAWLDVQISPSDADRSLNAPRFADLVRNWLDEFDARRDPQPATSDQALVIDMMLGLGEHQLEIELKATVPADRAQQIHDAVASMVQSALQGLPDNQDIAVTMYRFRSITPPPSPGLSLGSSIGSSVSDE